MTIFSQEQLARIVKDTLPSTLPIDKKGVLVGTVDVTGAQVVVGYNFKNNWQVSGAFKHDWSGNNEVGAKIIGYF
jgi:hypothetical protein